jgi:membrane-bound lytic murein transglycosylase D
MKYILLSSFLFLSSCAFAQNVTGNDDDKTEDIDLPEGMLVSDEELMEDYVNKENLHVIANPAIKDLSYDDSVLVSRLLRIPTTIEMPLNNVTRKFIEQYSNKRKRSVAIMLGSANFYMPIFE